MARKAGLVYVSDAEPGFRRRRVGKGFAYLDENKRPLRDARHLLRIRELAVPPAYREVWICRRPRGHLQATGLDARGRKQYRYHPDWRRIQDEAKFARMIRFAQALPRLRRKIRRHLARKGLPREKVLATVVSLLDSTHARVGNAEYARANRSYGLTTLRSRHLRIRKHSAPVLAFAGKNGTDHRIEIEDARLAAIVRRCHDLPGRRLFQYVDEDGQRHAIGSSDVNDYLRAAMRDDFTAKDFRTWAATLQAAALLGGLPVPSVSSGGRQIKRGIAAVVATVATTLRNTPAVCRKSYINPVVFAAWESGVLHARLGRSPLDLKDRRSEQRVLRLLRRYAAHAVRKIRKRSHRASRRSAT